MQVEAALHAGAYGAVFAFAAVNAGGIPFPGQTMLTAAAIYASGGKLLIPVVIASAALGALVGSQLSYAFGVTGGRTAILRYGKALRVDAQKLGYAERFFARHGNKTVILARFVSVGRTWIGLVAGVHRMPFRVFSLYNLVGSMLWALLFGTLAYELGRRLPVLQRVSQLLAFLTIVVGVALALTLYARRLSLGGANGDETVES